MLHAPFCMSAPLLDFACNISVLPRGCNDVGRDAHDTLPCVPLRAPT